LYAPSTGQNIFKIKSKRVNRLINKRVGLLRELFGVKYVCVFDRINLAGHGKLTG